MDSTDRWPNIDVQQFKTIELIVDENLSHILCFVLRFPCDKTIYSFSETYTKLEQISHQRTAIQLTFLLPYTVLLLK